MAFIKFIIIVFGVYYLLKITLKALFPFLLKKTFDKMQNNAQEMQNKAQNSQTQKGKVTVKDNSSASKSDKKTAVGDYVDFEEVD